MLRNEDLEAAVKAGVITAEQQVALEAQAGSRRAARPFVAGRDERFRFLRGFNDVFLTLGVVLVAGAFLTQWSPAQNAGGLTLVAGAAVLWAISEVLVARHKAVLPGMAAVVCIGALCGIAGAQWATIHGFNAITSGAPGLDKMVRDYPFGVWLAAAGSGGFAVLLFYLRFRLPFALLPLGLGLMATVLLALINTFGLATTKPMINGTALLLGLGAFALAMRYDASDPERLTRRSDCGFWLHLAAAPFIVHPVISMLAAGETAGAALATIAVVLMLGVVALAIDRRALLVSSLAYFGLAVGYLMRSSSGDIGSSLTLTLGLLGLFVILMGLGWHRLRGVLLSPFAGRSWLKKLPPVQKTILA